MYGFRSLVAGFDRLLLLIQMVTVDLDLIKEIALTFCYLGSVCLHKLDLKADKN